MEYEELKKNAIIQKEKLETKLKKYLQRKNFQVPFQLESRIKTEEKLRLKSFVLEKEATLIGDIIGFRFIVENYSDMTKLLDLLAPIDTIPMARNYIQMPKEKKVPYFALQFQGNPKDESFPFEIQIMTNEMKQQIEKEQIWYNIETYVKNTKPSIMADFLDEQGNLLDIPLILNCHINDMKSNASHIKISKSNDSLTSKTDTTKCFKILHSIEKKKIYLSYYKEIIMHQKLLDSQGNLLDIPVALACPINDIKKSLEVLKQRLKKMQAENPENENFQKMVFILDNPELLDFYIEKYMEKERKTLKSSFVSLKNYYNQFQKEITQTEPIKSEKKALQSSFFDLKNRSIQLQKGMTTKAPKPIIKFTWNIFSEEKLNEFLEQKKAEKRTLEEPFLPRINKVYQERSKMKGKISTTLPEKEKGKLINEYTLINLTLKSLIDNAKKVLAQNETYTSLQKEILEIQAELEKRTLNVGRK